MTRAEKAELVKRLTENTKPQACSELKVATAPQTDGLTGTEKQVKWAIDIRAQQIAALESEIALNAQRGGFYAAFAEQIREAIAVLLWERRAAKWIEHRSDQTSQLLQWAADLELVGELALRSLA